MRKITRTIKKDTVEITVYLYDRKPENEKKAWPIILKISGIAIMAFML